MSASSTTALSSTLAGAFVAGQLVACTVTASDGKSGTDTDTASVTIGNNAPVVSSVTLSPSTVFTNDTLTANVVSSDADGDSLSLTYAWYVGGVVVPAATSSSLSGVSYFSKGQAVYVTVTANDGTTSTALTSSSVTVSNTAPTAPEVEVEAEAYAALGSTSAYADLNQPYMYADVVYAERDGVLDSFGVYGSSSTCGSVDFFVLSSSTAASGAWTVEWSDSGDFSSSADYQTAGDVGVTVSAGRYYAFGWATTCSSGVQFYYGLSGLPTDAGFGTAVGYFGQSYGGSSTLTGTLTYYSVYSAPEAMDVYFTPDQAGEGDDLTCAVSTASTDVDGDTLTYTFAWDVDGVAYSSAVDGALASVVDGADVGGDEVWTCEVEAGDGDDVSAPGTASVEVLRRCDADGDGFDGAACGGDDCDDTDALIYPRAGDTYGDGVDGDCDGMDCEAAFTGAAYFAFCRSGSSAVVAWADADAACVTAGYDALASIHDDTEAEAVFALVTESGLASSEAPWIGLCDVAREGSWVWSDGTPYDYADWMSGEPNGGVSENCVQINPWDYEVSRQWNDYACAPSGGEYGRSFICGSR